LVTLRCTANLLKQLREPASDGAASGRLGDWYARSLVGGRRHVVLCTNERSLLSIVVPLAPVAGLRSRFVAAAMRRIDQIPAAPELLAAEREAMRDTQFGRSVSRSVISTMNQLAFSAEGWLRERTSTDLEGLGLWLCDTPCSAISTQWPWLQAELLLTGAVAAGRRPLKSPAHVL
jgi:hypothetical protein